MRNPLSRPQTFTEAGSPGNSQVRNVKSLAADSPSTSTFTTPIPRKTLRQTTPRHPGTPHCESPCSRQPLDIHCPAPQTALRQTAPRAFANPRSNASRMAQRNAPMQKPAGPKGKLGQAQRHRRVVQYLRKRVSCATISVTYSGKSSGRLAQRERRCLTSTRSQVQILYRPPLKPQVRRFSSGPFLFSEQPRAYRTKARLN